MADEDCPSLSKTFEFSEADYSEILLKDSIFDENDTPCTTDAETLMDKLQHNLQREIKQYYHAVTLSDYLRQKIIPRGLRLQKSPAFGLQNSDFCTRWCEILNKCSFDLMALVITETTKQLESTKLETKKMEIQLGEMVTKSKLTEFKKDLERQRAEISKEIRAIKRTKFARDNADYQQGKIYFWKDGKPESNMFHRNRAATAGFRTRQQHGNRSLASSTSCDSDSDSVVRWRNGSTFLGRTQPDNQRIDRRLNRPRRGAEGAREKHSSLPPRMTRSNQGTH